MISYLFFMFVCALRANIIIIVRLVSAQDNIIEGETC